LMIPGKEDWAEVKSRALDFGLQMTGSLGEAVAGADAVAVVWRASGAKANPTLLEATLHAMPEGSRCFIHGALANEYWAAAKCVPIAARRGIALCAGTSMGVTYRLPNIELPFGRSVREALIVVQGAVPDAELDGLEALLPILARRRHGEAGIRYARFLQ